MATQSKCSECGKAENVKPAWEYTELASWLEAWHSLETSGGALLCPQCAQAVIGDLSGETVKVIPLDPGSLDLKLDLNK